MRRTLPVISDLFLLFVVMVTSTQTSGVSDPLKVEAAPEEEFLHNYVFKWRFVVLCVRLMFGNTKEGTFMLLSLRSTSIQSDSLENNFHVKSNDMKINMKMFTAPALFPTVTEICSTRSGAHWTSLFCWFDN